MLRITKVETALEDLEPGDESNIIDKVGSNSEINWAKPWANFQAE